MTTQYSPILKLALPVQGELSGTWGDVVNDNITSMVEQAIAGRAVINTWTTNSHTLTSANGTTSESRCAMLELTDTSTALSGAGTVVCPTASKIYIVKNAAGQNITVKTSGGTGILVPNGRTTFLFCDGTNVVEALTHTTSLQLGTSTTVTAVLDEDNMASNSATSLATQQSIKAYVDSKVGQFDSLSEVLAVGNTTGSNNIIVDNGQKITTNTIDETTAGSGVTIDSVLLKDDVVNATDIETGSISANDGTAAATIANSTGVVTVPSAVLTTADINGGTADGVVIGGATPAAATVTTAVANTSLTIAGTTTVTSILDEDNMASNDPAGLATQQSIKAYVDSQVGTVDTLAEVLANGNTTGGNDIVFSAGDNITNASGDLTIDVAGDINLDAGGQQIFFQKGGTTFGQFGTESTPTNFTIESTVSDGDIILKGNDGGVTTTALTLDMSAAGAATFNVGGVFNESGANSDFRVESDSLTHALFVDAGLNSIALGSSTADRAFVNINDTGVTVSDGLFENPHIALAYSTAPENNNSFAGMSFATSDSDNYGYTWGAQRTTGGYGKMLLNFHFNSSPVTNNVVTFDQGETIFNDSGINNDFRIESDNNANMFFVDGGADRIGIGTSSPDRFIHAKTSGNVQFRFETTSESTAQMEFKNDAQMWAQGVDNLDQFFVYDSNNAHSALTFIPLNEVVFNQNSKDVDFRVESDNVSNMLHVDAGNNRLNIGGSPNSYSANRVNIYGDNVNPPGAANGNLAVYAVDSQAAGNGGSISLGGRYTDSGAFYQFGAIQAVKKYSTSGVAAGLFKLYYVNSANGTNPFLEASEDEIVINEAGLDDDFRVESDSNANMLFVDAGNNRVGVGTAPSTLLHLKTSGNTDTAQEINVGLDNGSASDPVAIEIKQLGGTTSDGLYTFKNYIGGALRSYFWTSRDNMTAGVRSTIATQDGGGTLRDRITMDVGETVLNDASVDQNFRVESNNSTHMIFVDSDQNEVGINTSNPSATLEVNGNFRPTYYYPHAPTSQTSSHNNNYWKLGNMYLPGPYGAEIVMHGAKPGYSSGGTNVGKLTILLRGGTNASLLDAVFYAEGDTSSVPCQSVRYVPNGNYEFEIYVQLGNYESTSHTVVTGGSWTENVVNTGSTSAPANSVGIPAELSTWLGPYEVMTQTQTMTSFNETSNDHDFRVESDSNSYAFFLDAGNNVIGTGTSTPATYVNSGGIAMKGGTQSEFANVGTNVAESATTHQERYYNHSGSNVYEVARTRVNIGAGQVNRGEYQFAVNNGAGLRRWLDVNYTGDVVFNADAHDSDFRVSSDANNYMLFVDAGNNVVNINSTGTDKRLRVDSGNITTAYFSYVDASDVSLMQLKHARAGYSGNTATMIQFQNSSGTEVGTIKSGGSGTNFNTSSDYRLKENVVYDWDATTRIKQLKPARFNFIIEPDKTVDGFLAHEAQAVVPEAVSGTHNQVDDNGDAVMQGIDQSKLVPLLVKTIQELEARITALENA